MRAPTKIVDSVEESASGRLPIIRQRSRGVVRWLAILSLGVMYSVVASAENPTPAPCSPAKHNDVVAASTGTRFPTKEAALGNARLGAKNKAADHCRENATVVPEACGDLWLKPFLEIRSETCDESQHGFHCTVSAAVWCVCTRCKAPPELKPTQEDPRPASPTPGPSRPQPDQPAPQPPRPEPPPSGSQTESPTNTAVRVEPGAPSPEPARSTNPLPSQSPSQPKNAAFDQWKADTAKQDAQARALAQAVGGSSTGGAVMLVGVAGLMIGLPVVAAATGNRTAQNMVTVLTFAFSGAGTLIQVGMLGRGALATGKYLNLRHMDPYEGALQHVLGPPPGFPINLGVSIYSSMGYGVRGHEGEVAVATITDDNEKRLSPIGAAEGTAHSIVGRTSAQLTMLRLTLMGAFQVGGEHTLVATGDTWDQTGFDLSGGFGVQPFHGGFLSPYLEARVLQQNGDADTRGVTLPSRVDAECCIEPTRGPVDDADPWQIVVGTTISFAPLFSTVSGRWERSLFLDVEAVVHLENPATPGFILTLGTESHLSF